MDKIFIIWGDSYRFRNKVASQRLINNRDQCQHGLSGKPLNVGLPQASTTKTAWSKQNKETSPFSLFFVIIHISSSPLTVSPFLQNIFDYDFSLVLLIHKYFVEMYPLRTQNIVYARLQNFLGMSQNSVTFLDDVLVIYCCVTNCPIT